MSELQKKSGFEIEIGQDKLNYNQKDYQPAADWVKKFTDASYAYKVTEPKEDVIYFGARYMERTEDKEILEKFDYMADCTVIKSGKIGSEFTKTVGHYHGKKPGTNIAYPEVYENVFGKFEYLLQSEPDEKGEVDVLWVVTEPGDKVVMIPGYGHVSMNTGNELAVEVDVQKRDNPNQSDYSMFKENIGGAIYRTDEGLETNTKYKIKSLRIVRPLEVPEWGLVRDVPLYTSMIQNPEKFKFLTFPEEFEFDLNKLFVDVEL